MSGAVASCARHRGVRRPFPPGPLFAGIDDIHDGIATSEDVVPVKTARVAVANYPALLHDFPQEFGIEFRKRYVDDTCAECRRFGLICPLAIDRWLVDNAAFVSAQQALPNEVNGAIDHGAVVTKAYRPPGYGRALILDLDRNAPVGKARMFDIKGAGVGPGRTPIQTAHGNGLEYLGVALADFFYGWLLDRILARTVPGYQTVPVYAVLDLGFPIVDGSFGTATAGLHVRRAHRRTIVDNTPPMSGSDAERIALHIELLIRHFGLTSTTVGFSTGFHLKHDGIADRTIRVAPEGRERARFDELLSLIGPGRLQFVNLQLAGEIDWRKRTAQIVDLGHINVCRRFDQPFATWVCDAYFQVGRLLMPGDDAHVQPDRAVAVDHQIFDRRIVTGVLLQYAHDFTTGRITARGIAHVLRSAIRRTGR